MNKEEINRKIEILEKEIAELKRDVEELEEPKFERKCNLGDFFYFISVSPCNSLKNMLCVNKTRDTHSVSDDCFFDNNNYFHTQERAEEVAKKIKVLLKLGRLHDIYCPDYVPNWGDVFEIKYHVYFDHKRDSWECDSKTISQANDVYYQSEEIAQKVCNILNKEGIKP